MRHHKDNPREGGHAFVYAVPPARRVTHGICVVCRAFCTTQPTVRLPSCAITNGVCPSPSKQPSRSSRDEYVVLCGAACLLPTSGSRCGVMLFSARPHGEADQGAAPHEAVAEGRPRQRCTRLPHACGDSKGVNSPGACSLAVMCVCLRACVL